MGLEAMTTSTAATLPLHNGDRLTRDEFERRYRAMPHVKKAELVEGVVYMPSPVSLTRHGEPHLHASAWLGTYVAATPGVSGADNATVRLDLDNEPQPDLMLRIDSACGGQSRIDADGYVEGAPELVVEVTASRASYDLHDKLEAYRRNGVREYLVWRVDDRAIDWFVLRGSCFERHASDDGVVRSEAFPGLWLDPAALLRGDLQAVLATLALGTGSATHQALRATLAQARGPRST